MSISILAQYSKEELEKIVKTSFSFKEVLKKVGYTTFSGRNNNTLRYYLNLYNISYEHFTFLNNNSIKRTEENVFCKDSTATQKVLRDWFIKGQYVEYKCSICNIDKWNEKELTLQLDHIDGNNKNNELSNLRWLCPNCHSQTNTFAGKNLKNKEKIEKKNYCIDCGKEISSNGIRCVNCYNKSRRKVERPSPEQLEKDLKETNFCQVGRKYGVTDNTIRKWCKSYGMSTHSVDYK